MGNFYANITTRNAPAEKILDFLRSKRLFAILIKGPDNYCTIYEKICDQQNTSHISSLLRDISENFSCPAIGILNHDDDVLLFELWSGGIKVDEYNSCPGYFDPKCGEMEPKGGNTKVLVDLFGTNADEAVVEKALRESNEGAFIFAVERHDTLAKAIGLPSHTIGFGFNYLLAGEIPPDVLPGSMLRTFD